MRILVATLATVLLAAGPARAATDLLPDVVPRPEDLANYDVSWGIEPGCAALRLDYGGANVGAGPLHLYGAFPANPDGSQDVMQRIFRDDGSFFDRLAGAFVYHAEHEHIHFEGWALYRLRQVTGGGGVGAVLSEGDKTSFCLLDYVPHDLGLPGAPASPQYTTCDSTVQGVSVGYADIYVKVLPGQHIPLCGIGDGTYWVEAIADPDDLLLESDETNNVALAQVSFTIPPPPVCNDGVDNDGDGLTDAPEDPGCYILTSKREDPGCNDGVDNDGDGYIDFPDDPGCQAAWAASEGPAGGGGCGLGGELGLGLALLLGLRRRLERRAGSR